MRILLLTTVLLAGSVQANCIDKHERRILKLSPKAVIAKELSTEICKQLSPTQRDIAIAIAMTETGIKQINSRLDKDIGIFQISIREVVSRGLSQRLLERSIEYQVGVFKHIMAEKLKVCAKRYPWSAMACYHSSTPKYHYKYLHRVEMFYSQIKGVM